MANAILTLGDYPKIEGTADTNGDVIRFTPNFEIETVMFNAGMVGHIEVNGKQEEIKLESAGPAYINGTGTLMNLRRVNGPA